MFVPNAGAFITLAAMTAFLTPRQIRTELIAYLLGCALAPAAVLAYLIGQHTLAPAFDDVIRNTVSRYVSINVVRWGYSGNLNRPLKYVFQLVAVLSAAVVAYSWRAFLFDRQLRLCVAFTIAGLLSCYPRPDIIHISYSVPLALPLLAFCITRLTQFWRRPAYRYAAATVMIALCWPSADAFRRLPAKRSVQKSCRRREATWRSSAHTPAGEASPNFWRGSRRPRPGMRFLLSLRRDAAVPECARTRIEI